MDYHTTEAWQKLVEVGRLSMDLHRWFTTQASWTRATRLWLYRQAGLGQARSVLEVGCGTGVIAAEVAGLSRAQITGVDIDAGMLAVARQEAPGLQLVQGDAHALPFPDSSFDLVLCHFLLLWLRDPARGVREMARVVRPGGTVLACAEPDYGGRVDHPPELVRLGWLQAEALRRQGANPEAGRRLGEWFSAAGMGATAGVIAGQWPAPAPPDAGLDAEWAMRRQDLAGMLDASELDHLEQVDRAAAQSGARVLFVPTFYAWGRRL